MIRITFGEIRTKAKNRPAGYLEDILQAASEVTDTHILLTEEKWRELSRKYTVDLDIPKEAPGMLDLVTNFTGAVSKWAKAGFPVTSEEDYETRIKICQGCPNWKVNPLKIDVLGTCKICGCTGFKPWLATENCPINKW